MGKLSFVLSPFQVTLMVKMLRVIKIVVQEEGEEAYITANSN